MSTRILTRFVWLFWCTLGAVAACVVAIGLFVRSVGERKDAYELRLRSSQLAAEFWNSSDELTHLARSYAVTGDRQYSERYREILEVRQGRRPRPSDYDLTFWELPTDVERTAPTAAPASLTERMVKSGFTPDELAKVTEALNRSERLTQVEQTAMHLADLSGEVASSPSSAEQRLSMLQMLHDAAYYRAKGDVMRLIAEFDRMVEARTRVAVQNADRRADLLLATFIALGGVLVVLGILLRSVWRALLGGSVSDLHDAVTRAARGDFSAPASPVRAADESIMGRLVELQRSQAGSAARRPDAAPVLTDAERRFRDLVSTTGEGICVVQDAVIRFANAGCSTWRATGKRARRAALHGTGPTAAPRHDADARARRRPAGESRRRLDVRDRHRARRRGGRALPCAAVRMGRPPRMAVQRRAAQSSADGSFDGAVGHRPGPVRRGRGGSSTGARNTAAMPCPPRRTSSPARGACRCGAARGSPSSR
jgi:hypothetical protein